MPRASKRKTYHHGDLRSALIAAALMLVKKKGPRGFVMAEAARQAGVSIAAPYRHFVNKESLLVSIVLDGNRLLLKALKDAARPTLNPRQRLVEAGVAYVHFAVCNREYFDVMFQGGIPKENYPDIQKIALECFSVGLNAARDIKDLTASQQETLALSVWTTAHGIASLSSDKMLQHVSREAAAEGVARHVFTDQLVKSKNCK